jgi:RNA 3'-terminal phosphate cyclase (ATP)
VIEIDGSTYSGSGTLVRYAVALATLIRRPLHMTRIRAKREKPGLRPQHLQAVKACADLSGGRLEGAETGSSEILYYPGAFLGQGDFEWNIGTAGSTTMLTFTLRPLSLFAPGPTRFSIIGGLFQDFAPSAFHMQKVLIPVLERMGAEIRLVILRPGYVPKGQGHLVLEGIPVRGTLRPLELKEQGRVREISGISLSSHLENERVSERMADRCRDILKRRGIEVHMEVVRDKSAVQKGAALLLRAETDTGALLGADQAGKPGRRSEAIADFVAHALLEDLNTGAATDRHLADQLILCAALARGKTEYTIPGITDHVRSNLWLVEKMLGAKTSLTETTVSIEGIGFQKDGN